MVSDSTIERYTHADPDVRLMLRVRDDDPVAFEELMLRYQDRVVGLLAHLVGRRDLAEDLAQDVFLRVYRARKRYVPGAKFSTFLFTVVNNVASNALRSLSRRKEINLQARPGDTHAGPAALAPADASAMMPTRQVDDAELREAVQRAVATLGERQRVAVLLAKFEGLSYQEIGQVLGMSPQAVKSLLSRAREKLREVLEPYVAQGRGVT